MARALPYLKISLKKLPTNGTLLTRSEPPHGFPTLTEKNPESCRETKYSHMLM